MAKQVFEFTDLEVMEILANKLCDEGKLPKGPAAGVIQSEGKQGGKGFVIRIKIEYP